MSDAPKRKAIITRSFEDAGTGENFTAGETRLIDAGAFANYEAAGLVRAPGAPEDTAKADPEPTKSAETKR